MLHLTKRLLTSSSKRLHAHPMMHCSRRWCSTDSSEDEEFMFPIHFVMGERDVFAWSVNHITRNEDFSIAAENFGPVKELIYSSKSLKIMRVDHSSHGVTAFGLAKDETEKWKITSIYNFNRILEAPVPAAVSPCIENFLSMCNQPANEVNRDILTIPYHLIVPPHALHVRDFFTNIIKFPSAPIFAWNTPPSILLMSEDKCLLEGKVDVAVAETNEVYEVVLLLLQRQSNWKIGSVALSKI